MLRDLTKKAIEKYNNDREKYEQFFIDNYSLEPGVYVKLEANLNTKDLNIIDVLEINNKKDEIISNQDLEKEFKLLNKKSFIQISNKTIDVPMKKIYSTNIFSFSVKMEQLEMIDFNYFTNNYFNKLLTQQKFIEFLKPFKKYSEKLKKNQELLILKDYLESDKRKETFELLHELYKNSFNDLKEYVFTNYQFEKYKKTYFKFYITGFDELYQLETDLYFYSYSFLDNNYNFLNDNDILFGVPAFDTTYNSKKPFMESRTRHKMSIQEAIPYYYLKMYKDVYNYVIYQNKNGKRLMDAEFNFDNSENFSIRSDTSYQIYTSQGIDDFEIINKIDMKKDFKFINYLEVKLENKVLEMYRSYKTYSELRRLFFLVYIYERIDEFRDIKKIDEIKSPNISTITKNMFFSNKNALQDFFYNGNIFVMKERINKITTGLLNGLVKSNIESVTEFRSKVSSGINLKINFLKYFDIKEGDDIVSNLEIIKKKLKKFDEDYKINSLDEFCYVAGILGYYFAYQSEAKKKTYQLLEGIYNATNVEVVKIRLTTLFEKYKHKIGFNNKYFKILFSEIMSYETLDKIKDTNKIYLYTGSISDNILLKGNAKEGDEENE